MILVTKPFLPPIDEYNKMTEGIWSRNWLTNNGPLVNDLELRLKEYLKVKHMLFLGNGTIALQMAIKALDLKGEIITTPFSYVATTHSIAWEGCQPVFADIDESTLNIDPAQIERHITSSTSAILATHCFGNPCDVEKIDKIARKHNLKVIYDAAHCFGTKYKGKSIFHWGDISTTSFHATKLFHTVEGGAVFTNDANLLRTMSYLRNFGHDGPERFAMIGVNGKNSEFHAAMGLCNLKYIDAIIESRRTQYNNYNTLFKNIELVTQTAIPYAEPNYSYYPMVFESEEIALKVKFELERNKISPRRYFYPSLSSLTHLKHPSSEMTPIADAIAKKILCLPMYYDLSFYEQEMVARIVIRTLKYS